MKVTEAQRLLPGRTAAETTVNKSSPPMDNDFYNDFGV